MPRIVYAIASDGLLPPWVGAISPRFQTPVAATMLCGLFAATMALIFDVQTLASMMSIGTLIAYTLVCVSVVILRFREWDEQERGERPRVPSADAPLLLEPPRRSSRGFTGVRGVLQVSGDRTELLMWGKPVSTYAAATQCLLVYIAGMALACSMGVVHADTPPEAEAAYAALLATVVVGLVIAVLGATGIFMLPSARPRNVSFVSPLFPGLPLVAIAINIYLLVSLDKWTWLRFAVWCALGTAIYLGYGIRHSKAGAVVPLEQSVGTAASFGEGVEPETEVDQDSASSVSEKGRLLGR
jgi:amino acid transporter